MIIIKQAKVLVTLFRGLKNMLISGIPKKKKNDKKNNNKIVKQKEKLEISPNA